MLIFTIYEVLLNININIDMFTGTTLFTPLNIFVVVYDNL